MLRSTVIAIKYGFLPNSEIKKLKKKKHPEREVKKNLLVYSWMFMTPFARAREIRDAFDRTQLLEEDYPVNFIEKLPP